MQSNKTRQLALGGIFAAVAVVIMCLGGLIPFATYVCPMLCVMTQFLVFRFCGGRISWVWFVVVAFLSLILAPDKEAAMVFGTIGYYPLIKQKIEQYRLAFVFKMIVFNSSVFLGYGAMIYLFGMAEFAMENAELGKIGLLIIQMLGNVTFFLMDRLLTIMDRKIR